MGDGLLGATPGDSTSSLPLIGVAATCCHPEAYDGAYDDLISRARNPDPDDEEIGVFTAELRHALADPGQLPGDELFAAVDYGDGSDAAFLRHVWHDMYGDQPFTARDRQKQEASFPAARHASSAL